MVLTTIKIIKCTRLKTIQQKTELTWRKFVSVPFNYQYLNCSEWLSCFFCCFFVFLESTVPLQRCMDKSFQFWVKECNVQQGALFSSLTRCSLSLLVGRHLALCSGNPTVMAYHKNKIIFISNWKNTMVAFRYH